MSCKSDFSTAQKSRRNVCEGAYSSEVTGNCSASGLAVSNTTALVARSKIWYSPGQNDCSCSTRDLAALNSAAPSSQNIAFSLSLLTMSYRRLASSSITIAPLGFDLKKLPPRFLLVARNFLRHLCRFMVVRRFRLAGDDGSATHHSPAFAEHHILPRHLGAELYDPALRALQVGHGFHPRLAAVFVALENVVKERAH